MTDAGRLAFRHHPDFTRDQLIHLDFQKVKVEDLIRDRMPLGGLQDGQLLAAVNAVHLHQAGMMQQLAQQRSGNAQGSRRLPVTIDDHRNQPVPTHPAGIRRTELGALAHINAKCLAHRWLNPSISIRLDDFLENVQAGKANNITH